jgi:NarL family two-component system response regulator LiaR
MNTGNKIKVLIIDDHDMVRKGLTILLESFDDFEVVADIDNGQMGVTLCRKYQPDVVLMDILMPGIDGIITTRMIHENWPMIQIIALTSTADENIIHDVVQAGAISYLLKNGSIDEVADAVRSAYHRQPTFAAQAIQALISTTQHPNNMGYDLTKRQKEVLALMIDGLNNRQIAKYLVISNSTVKNHICSIYSKLNTTNRTQTVAMAIKHQILERAK